MNKPKYKKFLLDKESECEWCGQLTNIQYQIPDSAPTGESSFVCELCATEGPPDHEDDRPDDYPCFDAAELFR